MYNISEQDLANMPLEKIVTTIYDSIPRHDIIDNIANDDIDDILKKYAALHWALYLHHACILLNYIPRKNDRWKNLKDLYEDAIKCLKFQYETFSRRVTIEKDNLLFWGKSGD